MQPALFDNLSQQNTLYEGLGSGAALLRGFALQEQSSILAAMFEVARQSHFRHIPTPGAFRMSVAMTCCGSLGWVTDRKGLPIRGVRSRDKCFLAGDASVIPCSGAERSCGGWVSGVCPRRLFGKSVLTRRAPYAAPGQERARFQPLYRACLAWFACRLPVRWSRAER